MTTALHKLITLAEFLRLPETKPTSEFIRDRIYQKPMPQGKYSRLQLKLGDAVNQVAETRRIALAFSLPEFLKLDLTVADVFSWLKPGN